MLMQDVIQPIRDAWTDTSLPEYRAPEVKEFRLPLHLLALIGHVTLTLNGNDHVDCDQLGLLRALLHAVTEYYNSTLVQDALIKLVLSAALGFQMY